MPLLMPVVLSALLFCIGVYGVLARRNAILVLMAVELMLNAVNINLVAFDVWLRDELLRGPGLHAVRHHHRRRRDRARPGDRAARLPQPRDHRSSTSCTSWHDAPPEEPVRVTPVDVALLAPCRSPPSSALLGGRQWPRLVVPVGDRRHDRGVGRDRRRWSLPRGRRSRASGESSWVERAQLGSVPTGVVDLGLDLRVDGFAALRGAGGHAWSRWPCRSTRRRTCKGDPRYSAYAALVSLFTAAMLLVVFADDLIVLLVGWEVMGVCSYFLIGHHWEQPRRPGRCGQGVPRHPARRRRLPVRHLRRSATDGRVVQHHRACSTHGLLRADGDDRDPAAALRRGRQVGAVPAAHLAAGRDGRPDADQRADPRGDDGGGRHLPGRPAATTCSCVAPTTLARDGGDRLHHDARRGARRAGPGRHQAGAGLLDGEPARLHARPALAVGSAAAARLPPADPRRVQGAAVPRGRLGHPRRRHQPDAGHGRAAPADAGHLRDDDGRAGGAGRGAAVRRLLLQGGGARGGRGDRAARGTGRRPGPAGWCSSSACSRSRSPRRTSPGCG